MTEVERTDPGLRWQRQRLDVAKLVGIYLSLAFAAVTMVVAIIALLRITVVTTTISDCTTPKGKCYQQQQQTNAQNRARLVNSNVATQWCARTSRSLDELQACVTKTLEMIGDK